MTDQDPTALPSWRGLLFGVLALAAVCLVAAWVLSVRFERRERPPSSIVETPAVAAVRPSVPADPTPAPLEPPANWQPAAGVLNDAHAISALMLAVDGKWPEADRHVRAMSKRPPPGDVEAARAGNVAGLARFRAGDYANAVVAFEGASKADPADVEVANNLGYAYLKAGRARAALAQLLRSLHLAPQRSSAWINLSEALSALGYDDASTAAVLLALRHTDNRAATGTFLAEATRNHPSEAFRKNVARALERIDTVPEHPRVLGSPNG